MIHIDIPGRFTLEIENLVLDYNGTVAEDGKLINGVVERLMKLKDMVSFSKYAYPFTTRFYRIYEKKGRK